MRSEWTDERLDDLAETLWPLPAGVARLEGRLDGVEARLGVVEARLGGVEAELRAFRQDFAAAQRDTFAFQRQMTLIAWSLAAALVATILGLVGTGAVALL